GACTPDHQKSRVTADLTTCSSKGRASNDVERGFKTSIQKTMFKRKPKVQQSHSTVDGSTYPDVHIDVRELSMHFQCSN
ncbi:hypothetical protein ACJMK2_040787, partial [Sinanodonta woodiana]